MSPRRPRNDIAALLLTPKWVVLTLLVVALSAVFATASSWQYQRAMQQVDAKRAAASLPVPVAELLPVGEPVPAASLGRLAEVAGTYTADAWVTGRTSPDGRTGVWLISAVDDGSGALTAVLRGWLPQRTTGTVTGTGEQVAVVGRVSSPENFYTEVAADGPDELVAITDQRLAQIWDAPIRPGYVVLTEQVPALGPADPQPVPPLFGTSTSVDFPWQNAGYAVQWITFIAFVGFMYWRFFTDDLRSRRERARAVTGPVAADVP